MAVQIPQADSAVQHRPTKKGQVYTSRIQRQLPSYPQDLDTLSKHFLARVKALGKQTAMRKKRYGIWLEYSWEDVYEHVANFAMGLVSLGFKRGETLAIIGENDPQMYWGQIAAHAVGAMSVCIFSDALANPDIIYATTATDSTFLLAHDQEQVDKALEVRDKLPNIRRVIYWEDKGMWAYKDDWLCSFDQIEALGRAYRQQYPNAFEDLIAQTRPQDTIILSMTSGTTSLPKFAQITHYQLIYGNLMNYEYVTVTNKDNWLSFSPMAWLTEQAFGFAPHLIHGMQVNFPEGPGTVPTDLREIAPVGLLFPSRVWENLAATVRFRINDSTWINRKLFELFMPVAYKIIDHQDKGEAVPPLLRALRLLGEFAVFEPLRDKIGLTRAKNVLTAGAMLSPDVIRFFRAIGVELRQLYASTETMGTIHIPGDVKLETVGVIVPGVEIKIAEEDQEILIRTPARFSGYYKAADKTGEAIDEEGWYHTGDAGYMREDGHLVYLERVKDMIELSNGKSFSPQYIEGRLKFSPYIADIMTVGGSDLAFVTALIVINFDNVARWAEKRGISFTTMVDLSQKEEVAELIRQDVQRVNASLPEFSRLRRFVILHKAFDADEGELTRTRKLKRRTLMTKYSDLLEAMYGDQRQVRVRAEVKYRDGREGVVETDLKVWDVDPAPARA
ncbi:MAG: AMP-binding protein [Anaerolineae bacterium]|nr:AMP-binding protein [Anaerolineae bacterium]MDW8171677.1 AMP-binding protein [Anaerolineae bacterium]